MNAPAQAATMSTHTMDTQQLQQLFRRFLATYDAEAKDALWARHRQQFREFWRTRVVAGGSEELADAEIDDVARILDKHGKGNTRES
ncbi:MAG: hypothetical protein HY682_10905, partial [Chloroflexi bacterium]|nr:hypothetical protein [Chloroflexota bacterium]